MGYGLILARLSFGWNLTVLEIIYNCFGVILSFDPILDFYVLNSFKFISIFSDHNQVIFYGSTTD